MYDGSVGETRHEPGAWEEGESGRVELRVCRRARHALYASGQDEAGEVVGTVPAWSEDRQFQKERGSPHLHHTASPPSWDDETTLNATRSDARNTSIYCTYTTVGSSRLTLDP
ncbi:hypothetical protein CONPUDRAFT_160390 [Coniophora puteana RWD-64-598 SS2]|uniref:Uncharacterized protein n=1 Tax=Coniophora puteana (strain RWD-64-598) TaxID=741705 RepID=R7SD95_CONPW|nr:uncharacterized protein CONPUDRAFT_160390 [Coniophora puteana RWD-64-598 SS2]EIW74141.1 hypothetical protein CONPUDRAFT_160390 [Coniophora puteana RWD-64-598 SS2]